MKILNPNDNYQLIFPNQYPAQYNIIDGKNVLHFSDTMAESVYIVNEKDHELQKFCVGILKLHCYFLYKDSQAGIKIIYYEDGEIIHEDMSIVDVPGSHSIRELQIFSCEYCDKLEIKRIPDKNLNGDLIISEIILKD